MKYIFGLKDASKLFSVQTTRHAQIGELAALCTAYRLQNADADLIHKWLVVFAFAQHGHPMRILQLWTPCVNSATEHSMDTLCKLAYMCTNSHDTTDTTLCQVISESNFFSSESDLELISVSFLSKLI
jgi:hypothetical protein